MAFRDYQFPKHLSYGSVVTPIFNTLVKGSSAGFESRNAQQEQYRLMATLKYGPRQDKLIEEVFAWFVTVLGAADSFRFHNPFDYKSGSKDDPVTSTDVLLVPEVQSGDQQNNFQLFKIYTPIPSIPTFSGKKDITKPVTSTVLLITHQVSGDIWTPLVEGVDFTIDYLYGTITLTTDLPIGYELWGGFEYDLPMRMSNDQFAVNLQTYKYSGATFQLLEAQNEPRVST